MTGAILLKSFRHKFIQIYNFNESSMNMIDQYVSLFINHFITIINPNPIHYPMNTK